MKIELKQITVRDVAKGYVDNDEGGVVGYDGKLNIRPKFQREFVYDAKKREAVLQTIRKDFPLNVFYWAVNDDGGTFEVLDGQQRTISCCQYVAGDFSISVDGKPMAFHNLTQGQQNQILDYELMIYFCEGDEKEKLDWFEIVNIAGVKLTPQELRNAVYTGPWLSDAKSKFSKSNGPAYGLASKYVSGSPNRQEFLETALEWIVSRDGQKRVEEYMSAHQHDPNANELWTYFRNVIEWVQDTFTKYRPVMKTVDWGPIYDAHKDRVIDTRKLNIKIRQLLMDDDIGRKKGIYAYVLDGDERHLSIRAFTESQRIKTYERQRGLCANKTRCLTPGNSDGKKKFAITEMEADHITPWSKGGKTEADNCQMLCLPCNRQKGGL